MTSCAMIRDTTLPARGPSSGRLSQKSVASCLLVESWRGMRQAIRGHIFCTNINSLSLGSHRARQLERKNVMKIKTRRKSGFTIVEIMIVVAVIGLLAGISTPRFIKARDAGQYNAIINNLRMIEES